MYDKQVQRIAEKLLESPVKEKRSPEKLPLRYARATQVKMSPKRTAQATQTDELSSFSDISLNVETEISENEENKDPNQAVKDSKRREKNDGTPYKTSFSKKIVTFSKNTPAKNEWSSLKQRVLSLTQQVSATRKSKETAVKALKEQKEISESLQAELHHVLQRLQITKNSVQVGL